MWVSAFLLVRHPLNSWLLPVALSDGVLVINSCYPFEAPQLLGERNNYCFSLCSTCFKFSCCLFLQLYVLWVNVFWQDYMDKPEEKKVCKVLCRQEEAIQTNSSTLMAISAKLLMLQQSSITHNTNVMNILHIQNQRTDSLEADCNSHRSLLLTQHMDDLSLLSNNTESGHSFQAGLAKDNSIQ